MKKVLVGTVVSQNMEKTIVVSVETLITHPVYKKQIKRQKRYFAHDQKQEANVGDKVEIVEGRPRSKNKRWELQKVIKE